MPQSKEWMDTARLLRRAGFGTTGDAVDAALKVGRPASYVTKALDFAQTRDRGLLATPPLGIETVENRGNPGSEVRLKRAKKVAMQRKELTGWWLQRMTAVEQPIVEKLTLVWHNHFATSLEKVREPVLMAKQNEKIRSLCLSDFRELAHAMLTDGAMIQWLDGNTSRAGSPNENLAREFLELFALGHGGGYTEKDVREGARALTGWTVSDDGTATLVELRRDGDTKDVLGAKGDLGAGDFCDAVLAHPNSPKYVATRLWLQLASDDKPRADTLSRLLKAYGPERDLRALTVAVLTDPSFYSRDATAIVGPIEWLIGLHRSLRVPIEDAGQSSRAISTLKSLGQLPFYPPSVGGWPGGRSWLSAAAAGIRLRTADHLSGKGDISVIEEAPASDRLDAAGYILGIGAWSDSSAEALRPLRTKPPRLIAAAANTPEYIVS